MPSDPPAPPGGRAVNRHGKRIPFDATRIMPLTPPLISSDLSGPSQRIKFDGLGSVPIDCIQLCEMGSSDEEGAYRAIAEMKIWPENMDGLAKNLNELELQ